MTDPPPSSSRPPSPPELPPELPSDHPGRPMAYRSRHRRNSDTEAHETGGGAKIPKVLDHPLVPGNEPVLVTDQASLERLVQRLRGAGAFGYDTEFIGEQTYHPRLCVIQVGTSDGLWLIDPFGEGEDAGGEADGLDLTSFWALLANPEVTKLVHAGQQDLEPVVRHLDRAPAAVFDTQVVGGFAGLGYPISLDRLAQELAGADLGHGAKFSQWDRRPLTELQKAYAANDVRYLPLLHHLLKARLAQRGNAELAAAACAELGEADRYRPDPHSRKIKAKGVGGLSGQRKAVLRALVTWREGAALEADAPPRSLLSDPVMFDLAVSQPTEAQALERIKGLPRPVKRYFGQALLDAITQGQADPPVHRPRTTRAQRQAAAPIIAAVWPRIQQRLEERGIDPTVVISKRQLTEHVTAAVAARLPADPPVRRGYRAALLGDLIDQADAQAQAAAAQG